MVKRLSILGATGSIGRSTLSIAAMFPEKFRVSALTAKYNTPLLAEQIRQFRPAVAAVYDAETALRLKKMLSGTDKVEILYGHEGYITAAALEEADMVVAAMMGSAGLLPTIAAIDAKKEIALANKETLVMAGEWVMERARNAGIRILPVDSEHSAVFQCLNGQEKKALQRIILTASGGPFLQRPKETFSSITPEDALRHPNWRMGKKITIDSATLMNKGLEVIEARWLFDIPRDRIDVVIHPQSIIHSMAAYQDGAVLAQLGIPDMKGAIAYALAYPERLPIGQPLPDFPGIGAFSFQAPDYDKFPCPALAFAALKAGGDLPAVMNGANEAAVEAFLDRRIRFSDIPAVIDGVMGDHKIRSRPTIEEIVEADRWAKSRARTRMDRIRP